MKNVKNAMRARVGRSAHLRGGMMGLVGLLVGGLSCDGLVLCVAVVDGVEMD